MTDPERPHTTEPAEGDPSGDDSPGGRTPHPQEPAEGADEGTAEDAAAADVFGG
jgi:hypothetical protein